MLMPELPDIEVYRYALGRCVKGHTLTRVKIISPFLLRTVEPPIEIAEGKAVRDIRRIGKRNVLELDDDVFLVFHLMIAGRFRWLVRRDHAGAGSRQPRPPARITLATFEFEHGILTLTEAGKKKRASLHVVQGEELLAHHRPEGIEPLEASPAEFRAALTKERHTLKRALTDPRLFSGIGNAYSDEILHAARLSPLALTTSLTEEEIPRLIQATKQTLGHWTNRLLAEFSDRFPGPGDITAFRPDFAVHGRYGEKCRVCGTSIQRIRYAENETNYCPACQTGGRVLADRSLSRLLRSDWPRTIEELEGGKA